MGCSSPRADPDGRTAATRGSWPRPTGAAAIVRPAHSRRTHGALGGEATFRVYAREGPDRYHRRMRIAMVSSECEPFAKTGGLADVVDALARALGRAGHSVDVYCRVTAGSRTRPTT